MTHEGKVYLVGAGPGDPGLITVRAAQLLRTCDAVVYDRLVPLELVVALPSFIERYFVGKSSDGHSLPQEEINALLVDLAQKGLKVVRLKGGDPFVFGRGGEEALYLKERGIPFEVVPGVTAGVAASAYAGIPVTHRKKSVFTIFLTAHEAADKDEPQIPWDWLGKVKNGSIVGYMGVNQLSSTVQALISAGLSPDTPAALVEKGTTGVQKNVVAVLKDLPELAREKEISPPALFIVGEVVTLADDLTWFGGKILAGKTALVTRPADQAGEMYAMLRGYGAEILPLPTIATSENFDAAGWDALNSIFQQSHPADDKCWLVFTSENGVRYFIHQLLKQNHDFRVLGGFSIAAVGSGTARALNKYGLKADFMPSKATTAALAAELSRHLSGSEAQVIRIRGNLGDDRVEKALQSVGAKVIPLRVYDTFTAKWDAGMWAALDEHTPDIITFTSGSTVTGFVEILGKERAKQLADNALVASIGPLTTQIATEAGIKVNIEAETHSIPELVNAIVGYYQNISKQG